MYAKKKTAGVSFQRTKKKYNGEMPKGAEQHTKSDTPQRAGEAVCRVQEIELWLNFSVFQREEEIKMKRQLGATALNHEYANWEPEDKL
ncbi:hypothetical protein NPIL_439161 [Nephila pilipes]|uniref:Uncharacterized protein n=1 Tax=Nephila pilipes TaxID=299642 RepID=A0A8X6TCW1_NEPPI|nr:hypothetical protein NPIL_439161 [Nephila pilipes]